MSDFEHLSEEGAELAACGDAERLRSIREDCWIDYPAATTVLATLNEFLSRPRTTRMPSVAIYADSGMGKTMLMQRFLAEHRSTFNRATGTERTPVLSLQMVSRPNEKRFYSQLMDVIGAPPNPRTSVADLEIIVLRMLRQLDLKMLLIDETHNILASTYNDQRAMLNLLRFISNELRVSIVCFGVSDAKEAISGDVQLARRFQEFDLPRWKADEKFQALVIGILRNLPLRLPSVLSTRALRRILQVSDGVTSQIFGLLYEASEIAIRSKRECIDDDLMDEIHAHSTSKMRYA
jgi:Cdc6-like AAA superfamily ATPase